MFAVGILRDSEEEEKRRSAEMVGAHISSDRALVLVVMPARPDLEADAALDLVKEYDPTGKPQPSPPRGQAYSLDPIPPPPQEGLQPRPYTASPPGLIAQTLYPTPSRPYSLYPMPCTP